MALSFQPKSEEEVNSGGLLQPGTVDFEVLTAEDTASKKSGLPMIKLKLGVFRNDGGQQWITDYLIETMPAKLRHFCDAVGLLPKYQSGTLQASDCLGRSGKAKIVIESKEGFQPRNVVKDYVCRPAKPLAAAQAQEPETDTDTPF